MPVIIAPRLQFLLKTSVEAVPAEQEKLFCPFSYAPLSQRRHRWGW